MLFLRSEENVNHWCQERELPRRPIVSLEQLWRPAVTWYGNCLTVESRRPKPDEMVGIFAATGLKGPFWDPSADLWD